MKLGFKRRYVFFSPQRRTGTKNGPDIFHQLCAEVCVPPVVRGGCAEVCISAMTDRPTGTGCQSASPSPCWLRPTTPSCLIRLLTAEVVVTGVSELSPVTKFQRCSSENEEPWSSERSWISLRFCTFSLHRVPHHVLPTLRELRGKKQVTQSSRGHDPEEAGGTGGESGGNRWAPSPASHSHLHTRKSDLFLHTCK